MIQVSDILKNNQELNNINKKYENQLFELKSIIKNIEEKGFSEQQKLKQKIN